MVAILESSLVTGLGLAMDIAGVLVLYFGTSFRNAEAHFNYGLLQPIFTKEPREMIGTLEEAAKEKAAYRRLERSVRRNAIWVRVGISLVVSGFALQLIDLLI